MSDIKELISLVAKFRDDRDWAQFHNPKDLAVALSIEASELNELYLWRNADQLADVDKTAVEDELADIITYALLLADKLELDVATIVKNKLVKNEAKYPADKVRGSSKKYDEYKQS